VRHRKTILVLGSGSGGVARAFESASDWKIVRIDNNPRFVSVSHTRTLDILDWMDWIEDIGPVELLWASIECYEFTTLVKDRDPDLRVAEAVKAIIDHLKPQHWVIENVRGACKWFDPLYGKHRQVIGPFFLWGVFPWLDIHVRYKGRAKSSYCPEGGDGRWLFNGQEYNKWGTEQNAEIPITISSALLDAVEGFVSLEEFS
jgi:site-specific DNA-cytosine methylase